MQAPDWAIEVDEDGCVVVGEASGQSEAGAAQFAQERDLSLSELIDRMRSDPDHAFEHVTALFQLALEDRGKLVESLRWLRRELRRRTGETDRVWVREAASSCDEHLASLREAQRALQVEFARKAGVPERELTDSGGLLGQFEFESDAGGMFGFAQRVFRESASAFYFATRDRLGNTHGQGAEPGAVNSVHREEDGE